MVQQYNNDIIYNDKIIIFYDALGDARYRYQHSIRRSDITKRRLAITYRELPWAFVQSQNEYYHTIGREFLDRAEKLI